MTIKTIVQNLKDEMHDRSEQMGIASERWFELMNDLKSDRRNRTLRQVHGAALEEENKRLWDLYEEIKPALEFIIENYDFATEAVKGAQDFQKAQGKQAMTKKRSKKLTK